MLQMTSEFRQMVDEYFSIQFKYQAAIREVQTRLEILDDEFSIKHSRNPIHSIHSRMKTVQSIIDKLERRGKPISIHSATENLTDIAGIRVICSYIDDIYTVADLLTNPDDIRVVSVHDYIKTPKANGYRSLHLIVDVPVFLSDGKTWVPVEIQIRTIAMDFWASLEHSIRYKAAEEVQQHIADELLRVATDIGALDERMQSIRKEVETHSEN